MSMITTAAWVPRGFAAPFPTKYTFDDAELERIAALAKLQLDEANEGLEEAREEEKNGTSSETIPAKKTALPKRDKLVAFILS
jgi:periodic tryptophan protein 1